MFDKSDLCVMEGSRSSKNCNLLGVDQTTSRTTCLMSKLDETNLWHKRIGHLNLKTMKKVILGGVVKGIP